MPKAGYSGIRIGEWKGLGAMRLVLADPGFAEFRGVDGAEGVKEGGGAGRTREVFGDKIRGNGCG